MDNHCSIIIVNWNGGFDTIECLETVLKQDYNNFNIILVDNGSTDGSLDLIREWACNDETAIETNYPNLVFPYIARPINIVEIEAETIKNYEEKNKKQKVIYIIKNDENLGFARANNIAIKFAQKILKSYMAGHPGRGILRQGRKPYRHRRSGRHGDIFNIRVQRHQVVCRGLSALQAIRHNQASSGKEHGEAERRLGGDFGRRDSRHLCQLEPASDLVSGRLRAT